MFHCSMYTICGDDIYIQDDDAELPPVMFGRSRKPEDSRRNVSILDVYVLTLNKLFFMIITHYEYQVVQQFFMQETLNERRELLREQDIAYEESL